MSAVGPKADFKNATAKSLLKNLKTGDGLISTKRTDDESPFRGPYKIEDWGKTWLNPNKERVLVRVPAIALPDIAGYWPQTTRPVRGPQEYAKRIIDLLNFIPDFRAEPIEHAT